jgi:hypothetical protein
MKIALFLLCILYCTSATSYGKRQEVARFTAAEVSNGKLRVLEVIQRPAVDPRFIQITGISVQGNEKRGVVDAVQFNMTTYNESTLSFAFLHGEAEGPTTSIEAFFFALRSFAVFEYLDNDGISGFQQSNGSNADQIVSMYDLSKSELPWKPLVINSTIIKDENDKTFKVSYVEAETADDVFFVRFVVTEHPIYVGTVLVTADKSKIDFGIRFYNEKHVKASWTTGPSNRTDAKVGYIAITVAAAVFANFKNGTAIGPGEKSAVSFAAAGVVGTFEWDPTAEVHVQGAVASGAVYSQVTDHYATTSTEVFAAYSFKFLFFSFEGSRPDLIYWDPVFGADINYSEFENGSPSVVVYSFTVLLAFAVAHCF